MSFYPVDDASFALRAAAGILPAVYEVDEELADEELEADYDDEYDEDYEDEDYS